MIRLLRVLGVQNINVKRAGQYWRISDCWVAANAKKVLQCTFLTIPSRMMERTGNSFCISYLQFLCITRHDKMFQISASETTRFSAFCSQRRLWILYTVSYIWDALTFYTRTWPLSACCNVAVETCAKTFPVSNYSRTIAWEPLQSRLFSMYRRFSGTSRRREQNHTVFVSMRKVDNAVVSLAMDQEKFQSNSTLCKKVWILMPLIFFKGFVT